MAQRELPVSFELKRWFASGQAEAWWMAYMCRRLPAATIYIFDGDQLDQLTVGVSDLEEMRLPEQQCLFEVKNNPGNDLLAPGHSFCTHSIVYCWEDGGDIHGLLFQRKSRRAWTRTRMHAVLHKDSLDWEYTGTPEMPQGVVWTKDELQNVGMGVGGAIGRGCMALKAGAVQETARMPTAKRQKLARQGVGGFEYKIIDIPAQVAARVAHQGGTHASPRWHKRRGHYRLLRSGRRVWVRDCTVGDPGRGMVIKDYAVEQRP